MPRNKTVMTAVVSFLFLALPAAGADSGPRPPAGPAAPTPHTAWPASDAPAVPLGITSSSSFLSGLAQPSALPDSAAPHKANSPPVVERMPYRREEITASGGLDLPMPPPGAVSVPAPPPVRVASPPHPPASATVRGAPRIADLTHPVPFYSGRANGPATDGPPPAVYDAFPRTLAEMDYYDRMAMEPYPNYDTMSVYDKVRLYSRQFAEMHGREPRFPPEVVAAARASAPPSALRDSNRDVYKHRSANPASGREDPGKMESLKEGLGKELFRAGR